MQAIIETISSIKIGTPATFRNLTLFPLADGGGNKPDYLTLDEALAGKSAHITEVSEGGSVPELKFVNENDEPVFLLDGEELIGAKQNLVLHWQIRSVWFTWVHSASLPVPRASPKRLA